MPVKIENSLVERFALLYRSNRRSYGQFDPSPSGKRVITVRGDFTIDHVVAHLHGEMGLGLVPIQDDNTCWWAAIDIDVHGPAGSPDVNIEEIERKVAAMQLPLVVCRSKSGGVHCYVFFKEPQPAPDVRMTMGRWAAQLGYPRSEIFPKQSNMDPRGDSRPLGNWINLPYFDVEQTNRYCVDGGKEVSFDYFLALAEGKACTLAQFVQDAAQEYASGPPCLQRMFENKVDEGSRNTAAFQAAVFLKRAFPDDWRARLDSFNRLAFLTPLGVRELRQIGGSVSKRDYRYKCREEPCAGLCNKDLCKTRSHGITPDDEKANDVPLIEKVEQIIATPVRWRLVVRGKDIELTTAELFDYPAVRRAVAERLLTLLPPLKKDDWDVYLREILAKTTVTEEMTAESLMAERLKDFLRRIRTDRDETEDNRRSAILRGMPAYVNHDGVWLFAFKLTDFIEFLKRKKMLSVPDHQVHTVLRRALGDVVHRREKLWVVNRPVHSVWVVPETFLSEPEIPAIKHTPEY